MQGAGFEPESSHLSTLKVEFQATGLLDQKKNPPKKKRLSWTKIRILQWKTKTFIFESKIKYGDLLKVYISIFFLSFA
jgi:hypothetical protein